MREIKFRGKIKQDTITGKYEFDWFFGDLVREADTGKTFIVDLAHFTKLVTLHDVLVEVIPETIGQFTGPKDKNGKEIYEGDIVIFETDKRNKELYTKRTLIVKYNDGGFYLFYEDGKEYNYIENEGIRDYIERLEVIGNIYENPELLEVKNG